MPLPVQLSYLSLGENELTGTLPGSWGEFTSVSHQHLSACTADWICLLCNPACMSAEHVKAVVHHLQAMSTNYYQDSGLPVL